MNVPLGMPPGSMTVLPDGRLVARGKNYRCALGSGGTTPTKSEGDGATPVGCWPLRFGFYRADRQRPPLTSGLSMYPLSPAAGWCDDPTHPAYNQPVRLPFDARAERLWRSDNLYDILIVLGYNDAPVRPHKGSAIFLHVARPTYTPTEGCIALSKPDLLSVLRLAKPSSSLTIRAQADAHRI